MSDFENIAGDIEAAMLDSFGYPITYIPNGGIGEPITTTCLLRKPAIDQSSSPGYFADVDIDPLVVPSPQKRDQVVWPDGTYYVVSKVVNQPLGLTTVALHRKFDL